MELIEFKDQKSTPDIIHPYDAKLTNNNTPIVIDNGSYQCRVGWSTSDKPLLIFKNLIAKPRKERTKKDTTADNVQQQTPPIQVGNDIASIEAVRFQLKTQFDRNVVTHFEAQENIFDYVFTHLGVDRENCVPHPVLITEAVLNPSSSRQLMSELLFECYNVPSVCYGIDSLFAYHYNQTSPQSDGLIVSFGYHTIHVLPVLNGETIFANTRRLNIGGYHVTSFLYRILQLKYPAHSAAITLSRAEELLHAICVVALDYREELERWMHADYYEEHTKRIQLPYSTPAAATTLTTEQQKERKKELARRLTEMNARKREERLAEDEERLNNLLQIQEMIELDVDEDEVERAMAEQQIKSLDDLQKTIVQLNLKIEKRKQKILQSNNSEEAAIEEPPLKQQKLGKIVFESDKALHTYVQNAKKMRQEILNKKAVRKQRKQDMAKRRTAAGQERMRIISQLARKEKGNDDFGLRDEDWDIYKTISRDGGDSDSEAENEKLLELEEIIRTHEPLETEDTNTPGEAHQLHIGIERYRAPELIFKPYMQGCPEAGLSDVIAYVLTLFNPDEQSRLAANVVLTGGLANLPGMKERIHANLISRRPFQSYSNVTVLQGGGLAAWGGMQKFSCSGEVEKGLFTRAEYEERGGDYFKTHRMSNLYFPTPNGQVIDVDT